MTINHNELKFFTELETDKSIRVGISTLVGKISPKLGSHKSAWSYMLCSQLQDAGYENSKVITTTKEDWSNYDVILIDHGMFFKGTFNIFEGANDELYRQLIRLFSDTKIYSLHTDMPDIGKLIRSRLAKGTDLFRSLESEIEHASEVSNTITRIDHIAKTDGLCLGDSHSFSQWSPDYMSQRWDGLTLHGALNKELHTMIYPWTKKLRIYMGNIDIRHHLMRQSDPHESVRLLLRRYEEQLLELKIDIEVVHTLPIENISRSLPKTGQYKDTNYYGSWSERTQLVKLMNKGIDEMCTRNGWKSYKHSQILKNRVGELDFSVMEVPKSVHLSREFYRWDFINHEWNKKLIKQFITLF